MIGLPIHRLADPARRGIFRALIGKLVTLAVEPNRRSDSAAYTITGRVAAVGDMLNYAVPTGGFVVLLPDDASAGEASIVPLSVVASATMRRQPWACPTDAPRTITRIDTSRLGGGGGAALQDPPARPGTTQPEETDTP